jgi:Domain of unknown function (DUF3482)/Protein of unknown function (DUF2868)
MIPAIRQLSLREDDARALTLAHAVEASDAQGKLVSTVERDAIDRQLGHDPRPQGDDAALQVEALLRQRAAALLGVVGNRDPALAAYAHRRRWTRWLALGAPLAAVLLGAATDRIANPHRVDLLSLPLLAILAWNLAIYAALLLTYVLQRRGDDRPDASPVTDLALRLAAWHPRASTLHARVIAAFTHRWLSATAPLQAQRVRRVLHLAAAGWALGVVLSLFTRGLVIEYRVGWESTFLNAEQVHAILKILLLPVLAVFPFQSFSVQDIAALRFTDGAATGAAAGARWVYLYASLLGMVVIAPRLLLAGWARWREWQLAQQVKLDLDNAYYRRIIAMMHPAQVHLGLIAPRNGDLAELLAALQLHRQPAAGMAALVSGPAPVTLLRTPGGETLLASEIMPSEPAAAPHQPTPLRGSWAGQALARLRGSSSTAAAAAPPAAPLPSHASGSPDCALLLVRHPDDLDAALPRLRRLAAPMLLLVKPEAAGPAQREADLAQCRARAHTLGVDAEVLGWASAAGCWVQQSVLWEAIGRCLPAAKKDGFAPLLDNQTQLNRERFAEAMDVIARQMMTAAREVETVHSAPPSVTRFLSPADRQADAKARLDATSQLAARLQSGARQTQAALLRLHGLDGAEDLLAEQTFDEAFRHTAPVNARQAGMAGAATGAATGASVDLITGGLTLGAAAAIGALVGGGAALAGAAWKNRSTATGTATVQPGDDMLHALLEAALLRYLHIVHLKIGGDAPADVHHAPAWPAHLAAALAPRKAQLTALWAQARQPQPPVPGVLAGELQTIMREVLRALYPAAPLA